RHRLAGAVHLPHEVDHGRLAAHVVWGVATRDDHRVEVFGERLVDRKIWSHGVAVLALESLSAATADDLDLRARLQQSVVRVPQLRILIQLFRQDRDSLAGQLRAHGCNLLDETPTASIDLPPRSA